IHHYHNYYSTFSHINIGLFLQDTYGKIYDTFWDEQQRYEIFKENLKKIEEHNAKYHHGQETHHIGITQFADMTHEEFRKILGRQKKIKPAASAAILETTWIEATTKKIPDEWDWRHEGAVSDIKDQANCGSCWAFSATGAMEGQNAIHHKIRIPLSEQQLLDCSGEYGNGDCIAGGDEKASFAYVKDHGIETEAQYPYTGNKTKCMFDESRTLLNITGYKELPGNEEALKQAIASIGPISVAIDADNIQLYVGGIYTTKCKTIDINHAVLAVGYGSQSTKNGTIDYWIIKNSWGKTWGEQGYIRIQRNADNLCGIGLESSYPTLK
ncbi:unnamed protein product, partial [Phaedon cochleariae]